MSVKGFQIKTATLDWRKTDKN